MNFLLAPQPMQSSIPVVESLVISNLPSECKEPDLLVLAQSYGRVKSCEFKRDFRNHVITVNAILTFYDLESTERAFHYLNGANYFGKILRVEWMNRANPRSMLPGVQALPTGMPVARSNNRTAQVHFSYLSKQLQFIITEKFLFEVFSNYGEVLEVALKKTSVDPEMAVQNGYGFIHFPLTPEGVQAALNTVKSMHRVTLNQITFDCSVSNQLNQVLISMEKKSMQQQHQQTRIPAGSAFPGNFQTREDNYLPSHHLSHTHHQQQVPRGVRSHAGFVADMSTMSGMPYSQQIHRVPQQQLNSLARPNLSVQAPSPSFDFSSFTQSSPIEEDKSNLMKLSQESMLMLQTSNEILRNSSNSSEESNSPLAHDQQTNNVTLPTTAFRSSFASSTSSSNLSNNNNNLEALVGGFNSNSNMNTSPAAPFSLWSANY